MQKKIQRQLGHDISLSKCYKAKRRSKNLIFGNIVDQYKRQEDYVEIIRKINPESFVKLETNLETVIEEEEQTEEIAQRPKEIVVFHYMYIRFG